MKSNIIKVYDNFKEIGIVNRKITEGKEKDLVDDYLTNFELSKSGSDRKYVVFIETKVGSSYPDLVFVEYNPNNYKSWNKNRDSLTLKELKVLTFLCNSKGSSVLKINKYLGLDINDINSCLLKLVNANLVIREKNTYRVKNKKKLTSIKIKTVEAKIDKWNEVLMQSVLNKNFSDESYALVKSKNEPTVEVISRFIKYGVGLYCVNNNEFIEKRKAKKETNLSYYKLLFNEWVGRIINSEEYLNVN